MNNDRELLQQALDALMRLEQDAFHPAKVFPYRPTIIALRARLAQPEQEPVAWIPVADAMPKSGLTVLACYKNSLGNVRRIRAHWIAAKTEEAFGECEFGEYDEETDTYWNPEGWYECIDNWGEYSSVAVHEGEITHWMTMPSDPYTAPPQREWVGLTDGEAGRILMDDSTDWMQKWCAIEAKLKEKNSG